ncbi:ATP-binding protein [Opitutus sp. ER46]|uniref:ATP-binding protein n=1 Tax=Opitutus sp. ER46 TaxID=2161864 RepID=UPI000D2F6C6B|nr:ATP-binding protein [Opitutus sp. ER46]PTX91540.1 histidine kinase [Opitutus sp. ER46]
MPAASPQPSSLPIAHPAWAALREYLEVTAVIAVITIAAWLIPVDARVWGDVYLLGVIALCLRVGPWPILFAAVLSVVAWNYAVMPPRMSFSRVDLKEGVFLGTYFVVAIIAGQLTARIRRQELHERLREQRATTLFHLTRALSSARTLGEGLQLAREQADELFRGRTALLLVDPEGWLDLRPESSLLLDPTNLALAHQARKTATAIQHYGRPPEPALTWHMPLQRGGVVLGVMSISRPNAHPALTREQRELLENFATQIAALIEREQLHAAREREKLLAESERLHRTLLDSVSHELKTPIAVLRGAAERISRETGRRREELAGEILTATRRLDRLVNNLLSQTRLEAGRLSPRLDWCDARDFITAGRRMLGDALSGRPLKIEIPDDMPLFMADAALMEHVLANLLLNAAHHTPPDTGIDLSAGVDPSGKRVFITVADHGPGIPAEERAAVFQKFQRGAHATATGLGLGLSIVRGFMLAQGGDVQLADTPGGGATFTLYLPHQVHETVPQE